MTSSSMPCSWSGSNAVRAKRPGSITASMSRPGNCWDNACSETLSGSLKIERPHRQRFVARRHAKDVAIAWMLWCNQTRLHLTLVSISPVRFEQDWIAAQARQANS